MKVEIIDDVLPLEVFSRIEDVFLGNEIPWYYNKSIIKTSEIVKDLFEYQFTHRLYDDFSPLSEYYYEIVPLLEFLEPSAITRVKLNLQTNFSKKITYEPWHTDLQNYRGLTGVYYINSNDGVTLIGDKEIQSKKNRLVVFNPNLLHTGTSVTDAQVRVLVNINFVPYTNSRFSHLF